jgi:hypothetical protein
MQVLVASPPFTAWISQQLAKLTLVDDWEQQLFEVVAVTASTQA